MNHKVYMLKHKNIKIFNYLRKYIFWLFLQDVLNIIYIIVQRPSSEHCTYIGTIAHHNYQNKMLIMQTSDSKTNNM